MSRHIFAKALILAVLGMGTGVSNAQPDQARSPPPRPGQACDDFCQLGRALNQRDTPIQSQSGTGGGIVTRVPADKERDAKPDAGPATK
jgi:hypothetical protein